MPHVAARRGAPPAEGAAYEGQTYALLSGRVQTSKDSPWIIVTTLVLFLAVPAMWIGWEAKFDWLHVSPAVVILGAFFWLNAIAAMLYVSLLTQRHCVPRSWRAPAAHGLHARARGARAVAL